MNLNKLPNCSEILYLEADINYTIFHLTNGKRLVSSFTLKRYEVDTKWTGFLRVNKSFLLNPTAIINYEQEGNKGIIELSNGRKVLVSRRKIEMVRSFLNDT